MFEQNTVDFELNGRVEPMKFEEIEFQHPAQSKLFFFLNRLTQNDVRSVNNVSGRS